MSAPIALCDTAGMTNERWLECRAHGPKGTIPYTVGGSDVAAIFGVSPWTTPLELWMIKKGRMKAPIKANQDQLMMGHLLEPIAAYWYQQKTGNMVYDDTNLYQHADHPWALADFDRRFVRKEDDAPGILECKSCTYHKAGDWAEGAFPIYYELQLRFYLSVADVEIGAFSTIWGNNPENDLAMPSLTRDRVKEDMLYSLARIVAMELCEMQSRERAALTARDTEHRDALHVHVNMFGRMEIIAHDGTLHDNAFQGSSSYNLFAFLVLNRKSEHPLYQLATMIWENGESENPFSSIRNVNSRLRKTLDYIGLGRLIQVEHKMLSLNPAYVITTDVDGFDELNRKILQVRNAADPDMAVLRRLYEQVLALYQGSLLPRQDHYHWVMAKAVAYQNQYLGILNDYLELLYKERQFVKVQKIASDSLSIDVYASAMHFHLIRALLATGSKSLAKVYFRQSAKFLTDEHRRDLNRLFMNAGV
jgi:putative phage-type endonuclease